MNKIIITCFVVFSSPIKSKHVSVVIFIFLTLLLRAQEKFEGRKFYYYVYSIVSSDYKENFTYTSTYNIENENDLSTSDYATYNLVTKGDGWESYKIEYEYGCLSSFSFSIISSGWKMLKKM
jgi:hypothetical protein